MPEPIADSVTDSTVAEKPDVLALLDAANSASERVSGLHVAFIAVCVYVLIIVFGTTDLDLLMGKGIRLPLVDVEVPIVGFFAFSPFIILLVHFNLLIQVCLLSRKLFAFDSLAPPQEIVGGMRDRLHTFPYTHYIVGRPSSILHASLSLTVSFTIALLPIAALLCMQIQFLAYQSEIVTWLQRLATWCDVILISIYWPIILHPNGDWGAYWKEIKEEHISGRWKWFAYVLMVFGIFLILFSPDMKSKYQTYKYGMLILLLMPLVLAAIKVRKNVPRARAPRGYLVLLVILHIGILAPVALFVDGEGLEQRVLRLYGTRTWLSALLSEKRRLDLDEAVLLAKPPNSETLAKIRVGNWQEALSQIETINLQHRSLRGAKLSRAILIGADLRYTRLQDADLAFAQLQGARLEDADLRGAILDRSQFQEADMSRAQLQDAELSGVLLSRAKLFGAKLQRAYLRDAQLQGADLQQANLQGAVLLDAQFQGADLEGAQLQGVESGRAQFQGSILRDAKLLGADLQDSQFQGANMCRAQLQGAFLRGARFQGTDLREANVYGYGTFEEHSVLVDAREVRWEPVSENTLRDLIGELNNAIKDPDIHIKQERRRNLKDVLKRMGFFKRPGQGQPKFKSCLAPFDSSQICAKCFDPNKPDELNDFVRQVRSLLVQLACGSTEIARGIIRQIPERKGFESTREGLGIVLKQRINDSSCSGLYNLSREEKTRLLATK